MANNSALRWRELIQTPTHCLLETGPSGSSRGAQGQRSSDAEARHRERNINLRGSVRRSLCIELALRTSQHDVRSSNA